MCVWCVAHSRLRELKLLLDRTRKTFIGKTIAPPPVPSASNFVSSRSLRGLIRRRAEQLDQHPVAANPRAIGHLGRGRPAGHNSIPEEEEEEVSQVARAPAGRVRWTLLWVRRGRRRTARPPGGWGGLRTHTDPGRRGQAQVCSPAAPRQTYTQTSNLAT